MWLWLKKIPTDEENVKTCRYIYFQGTFKDASKLEQPRGKTEQCTHCAVTVLTICTNLPVPSIPGPVLITTALGLSVFCLEFPMNPLQMFSNKILLVLVDWITFEIRGQYWEQLCLVGGASADCRGPGGALEGPGLDMANLFLLTHFHPMLGVVTGWLLEAIASPSTSPCQWVIVLDLEIAIASPCFASLFCIVY